MATTAIYSSATVTTLASTTAAESENETLTAKYERQREESIQKLKSNLIRYTRANDRRMVLRSLKDVKYLSFIVLPSPMTTTPQDVPLSDLEHQVAMETLVLNNFTIKAVGAGDKKKVMQGGLYSGPTVLLKGLAGNLCESKSNPTKMDATTLYEMMIVRMAQTTASADPCLQLNSLLGSSTDLMVMQLSADHHKTATPANYIVPTKGRVSTTIKTNDSDDSNGSGGSKNGNNNQSSRNLVHLNLFVSHGEVHITLDMAFEFGLFRRSDLKPNRPWIALRAEVHERANLSTGKSYRIMAVKTPDLY